MKKIATVLLVVLISASAFSQDRKFRFGLKGAPSIAWLKPETKDFNSDGSKIGFTYGILGDINFSDNYAFATGAEINYNGGKLVYPDYKVEDTLILGNTTSNYSLQYVQIPLTLKMKTNEIGYMTYFAQAGLGLGINIGAESEEVFDPYKDEFEQRTSENDIANQIGLFRTALIVGLGAEYNISGNTSAFFGVSFNNGFSNIFTKEAPVYETEDGKIALDKKGTVIPKKDTKRKAISNYIALNLGVFF